MSPAAFRRTARVLAIALFAALAPLVSQAATITVTSGADSGPNSLRAAIAAANPGDTIVFNMGLPVIIELTSGELVISKDLTINGPGAFDFQISGKNLSRVFRIASGATVTISGLGIVNGRSNSGSVTGGGIHNDGTLNVVDCRLLFNTIDAASGSPYGGAIGNSGTLTVNRTLFEGNSAVVGGAIMSIVGNATIMNSTFTNNVATRASSSNQVTGGSAIVGIFGDVTIVNSTFAGNQATPGAATLGIFNDGTMTVSNSTLAGNSGAGGNAGFAGDSGNIKLKGTIFANAGDECSSLGPGQITSLGYNIADDASCASYFTQTGDLNSTSPGLDPAGLKFNGGPTNTVALASGSPAINAIPVSACKDIAGNTLATDQRGTARPQGAGCDIGAYEAAAPPSGPSVTCDAADGVWHAGDVNIHCTATASAGLANSGDASFYLMTSVAAGTEDANAQTDSRQVCDTQNHCATAGPVGGNKVDKKSPSASCGEADGLWHTADVTVSCSPFDGGSGLGADGDASFRLSTMTAAGTETSNASTGSRQICDAMGNCATVGPIGGHMIDKKAPAISCAAADGAWHAADVSLACTAGDGGSGLSVAGDANFSLSTVTAGGIETSNATTGSHEVCDAAGNCATAGPIGGNKVDKKVPSVSCGSADGLWHPSNISIACTGADAGSGLSAANASFSLVTTVPANTETSNAATGSRDVCDLAGHCVTTAAIGGNKVDRKAPAISIGAPTSTSYAINQPVAASYGCTDGGSGLASCAGPVASGAAIDTASFGPKTFTVTATDGAGNTSTQTVSYSVAYSVCIAYDPVKPVNSGATASIKIRLCNAAGANLSAPGIVVHATHVRQGSQVFPVQSPGNSQPGDNFRFDTDGYIFNLKTTGLVAGAYQLEFTIGADPGVRAAGFTVK